MSLARPPLNTLHLALVLLCLLCAGWINYIQHGWVNGDSVLYFEVSRLFLEGQWREGMTLWGWPFFSLLIAGLHKLTGLDLQLSAQIINSALFALAGASFLQIIREIDASRLALLSGALVLLGTSYIVGDILPMLLRDQGFWAFFLTGLLFLIRYSRSLQIKHAVLWQISIMIATLFRIEGITYLVLLPTVLLFTAPAGQKLKTLLWAHSLNILAAIALLGGMLVLGLGFADLGRLQELFTLDLLQQLTQLLRDKSAIMAEDVLGKYLDDFALGGLLLVFAMIVLLKGLSTAGWINLVLAVTALRSKPALVPRETRWILNATMLIAAVDMYLIIIKVFVLTGRYVVPLALVILVYSSLMLTQLIRRYRQGELHSKLLRALVWAIPIIMLASLLDNLWPHPAENNHEQTAIAWLKQHQVSDSSQVFYDSARQRYYAGEPFVTTGGEYVWQALQSQTLITQPYVVLGVSKKHQEYQDGFEARYPNYKEVIRFHGPHHKKATVIYKRAD